jgi:hypothetical protein
MDLELVKFCKGLLRRSEAQLSVAKADLAVLQAQMELPAPLTADERQGKGC